MTPKQKSNLLRLLKPRHIAAIGGRDVEVVATECARRGFTGSFWPVNPKRDQIGGHKCYASLDDLPEAPDAVFLAIPREPAIEALAKLNEMGAGGVVCYTAGFGEMGEEGAKDEARLIEAAGDLALIGPNCYGMINYVDQVALWPFAHGGNCPGYGAAIITQSGMLSSDLTMSQRSVPFAYMISAGNQTILHLDDFVDLLSEQDEVRAIGLHIEGLKDVQQFEQVALKALELGVPIVALKTGTSAIGSELTVSHTGSLSGSDDLYNALFDRLGIIRVTSPAQMLETLKFICVAGLPKGNRLGGFTCSGGGATMLADYAEKADLTFPRPSQKTRERLPELLPHTATISNPLDYTTPIWGFPEKTAPVFSTFLADKYDAAVIVQDYPAPGLDESKVYYSNDAQTFMEAAKEHGTPAAVCATLPENLDQETRDFLIAHGVAPMQGLEETLDAIANASWYNQRREEILASDLEPLVKMKLPKDNSTMLDEASAKKILAEVGIPVPQGLITNEANAVKLSRVLNFPLVVKMSSRDLPHKTEAGAVVIGVENPEEIAEVITQMSADVKVYKADAWRDNYLLETMVSPALAELMVSIRHDPDFGFAMTVASGGILVELIGDAETILLPADREQISKAIDKLKASRLMGGYRGTAVADRNALLDCLENLASWVCSGQHSVSEIEINPLFVMNNGVCAIDCLLTTN